MSSSASILDGNIEMNPFEVLGIPPESDRDTIDGAYLIMITENHPDKAKGAGERDIKLKKTQEITNAYALLGDDNAIRTYREKVTVGDFVSMRDADRRIDPSTLPDGRFVSERGFDTDAFNSNFITNKLSEAFRDLQSNITEETTELDYTRYMMSRDIEIPPPDPAMIGSDGQLVIDEFNKRFEEKHAVETNEIQESGRIGGLFGGENRLVGYDDIREMDSFSGGDIDQIITEHALPGVVDIDRATGDIGSMLKIMQDDRDTAIVHNRALTDEVFVPGPSVLTSGPPDITSGYQGSDVHD